MAPAETHPAALDEQQLLQECSRRTTRRTGPGGQHRNKTETAVVLTHLPTGLCGEGSESRSQAQNLKAAIFRLRQALAEQVRLPVEASAAPSELWRSLVRGRKLAVSGENANFPALLAEALDRVVAHEFDVAAAAAALEVSTTQLVRFLQQAPLAWRRINAERTARSLRPLR
ncbi:MAG: peptide chain release factor-like protein [Planctomycetales bacterium]|nr:peptide chain release factor-like protein [Planctomycetales bacterium]MBN8624230.1 peptide chain release factor-like protein [Planctomycetota bacterium]